MTDFPTPAYSCSTAVCSGISTVNEALLGYSDYTALSSYIAASEYGDTGFHFLAPEGQTITGVTFDNDSLDRRVIVLDDIGFVLIPEPATLCALRGAAVPMLRRRRARA